MRLERVMAEMKVDPLAWVVSLLRAGEPHRHHRHCVHNLSREEQLAARKRRFDGPDYTDEEMALLRLDRGIVAITPDDWEIEVPDLDFSRFAEGSE
jgi:hypothetical protein